MWGRDREQQITLEFVRRGPARGGAVLLVEGEPGIGKSSLLRLAVDEAARRGFALVTAAADELGGAGPGAPLVAALHGPPGPWPAGPAARIPPAWAAGCWTGSAPCSSSGPETARCWSAWTMCSGLTGPRSPRCASCRDGWPPIRWPGSWPGARRAAAAPRCCSICWSALARRGSRSARWRTARLRSWSPARWAGRRKAGLAELASGAAGNPFLLVELLSGLREEHGVQVARGRATLSSARLPDRVQLAVRAWLAGRSARLRPLLETAAVLGHSFRLEDVAEMLGEAPAALLPELTEALQAGLLTAGTDDFTFRHGLVWQAVTESVPQPARLALHRQFGGILLARGGSAAAAGAHLLASARPGDATALAGLDQAAAAALSAAPQTAADLALRALELTPPANPDWLPRSARAAESLAAAGRVAEAENIARVALAQPLPTATAAPLRCAMSAVLAMKGQPAEADAAAGAVLAGPGLSGRLRDEALVTQLHARTVLSDTARARDLAETILAAPGQYGVAAVAGAQLVLAAIGWDDGWASRGLGYARSAVRRISGVAPDTRHFQPLLTLAAMLVNLRMLDEASAVIQAAAGDVQALRSSGTEPVPGLLRARVNLALGRTDAAAAGAETALRTARAQSFPLHCSVALSVLGTVALRRGDLRAAAGHLRNRQLYPPGGGWYARTAALLAEAQLTEAASGPAAAMELAGPIYRGLPGRRAVLIGEPAAPGLAGPYCAGRWPARAGRRRGPDRRRDRPAQPGPQDHRHRGRALPRHREPRPGPAGPGRRRAPGPLGPRVGG